MNFKQFVKTAYTVIRYPEFGLKQAFRGCFPFYIGKGAQINSSDGIIVEDNFSLGVDSKITIIKEYHGENYEPALLIGKNVNIGNRFTALVADEIVIGNDTLIASDVLITSENHGMNPLSDYSYACQPLMAEPVSIGDGCWIGEKVTIMPGVSIGKKCIVAANAVVTHSCPDFCIVGGVPAKVLKTFDFEQKKWVRNS